MKQRHEFINFNAKIEKSSQKYHPHLFQPVVKTQIRVIDLTSSASAEEKQNMMLLYDKKMSAVLTYIKYDEALVANASNIDALRDDMHQLLDEAYRECHAEIMKNNPSNFILYHLARLDEQIHEIKKNRTISREIIEVACFKLGILCDLSRNSLDDFIKGKINTLLTIHLAETNTFKETVETVGSFVLYQDYANTKSTMPIFSKNGTIGFNTILFAEFNDYFPVGFSANPHLVHTGVYAAQSYLTSQHDYGHAFCRVLTLKNESPEVFEQYKQLYNNIIEQKKLNQVDDLSFKKDILMLFFLVHEIAYSPKKSSESVASTIQQRTRLLNEADPFFKDLAESGQDRLLTELLLIESIDFIKPLEELGYKINHYPNQKWKSAASIRTAMLDILDGFAQRHPEIILKPQQDLEYQY